MLNTLNDLKDLVSSYKAETCAFSLKINDVGDLDKLLDADLLRHEIQLQIDTAKSMRESSTQKNEFTVDSFGTLGRVHIPRVKKEGQGKKIIVNDRNVQVTSTESIAPSDDSEKMWFETREMTGGSRNILDLSMLGSLIHSSLISSANHVRAISNILIPSVCLTYENSILLGRFASLCFFECKHCSALFSKVEELRIFSVTGICPIYPAAIVIFGDASRT